MLRKIYKFYRAPFWAVNGALIGLLVGLCIIFLGVLKTLFVGACVAVGFFVGRKFQKDKNFLKNLIDKIIPPGTYR